METWRDVFQMLIMLVVGLAGAPITQVIKKYLSQVTGKKIEERYALGLAGLIAAVLALAEMFLSGSLKLAEINAQTFPSSFFTMFALATAYYQFFKKSDGFLGKGKVLK